MPRERRCRGCRGMPGCRACIRMPRMHPDAADAAIRGYRGGGMPGCRADAEGAQMPRPVAACGPPRPRGNFFSNHFFTAGAAAAAPFLIFASFLTIHTAESHTQTWWRSSKMPKFQKLKNELPRRGPPWPAAARRGPPQPLRSPTYGILRTRLGIERPGKLAFCFRWFNSE